MDGVRASYSYQLIQDQNILLGEFSDVYDYQITQISNFELLDEVYKQLKSGHYDSDDVDDEDLIY